MRLSSDFNNQIIPLEREKWQDYCLEFHYVANSFYDVEIDHLNDNFHVSFIKKTFNTPYEKMSDDKDRLFQPWWDEVRAWGILKDERLIAVVETAVEDWSNRLRVTELWVDDAYRRQRIGTALMDVAIQRAKDEKRRVVMLETQSCNEKAIAFYLAYGFSLIGFDTCAYSNNDIKRKEVRMEMGIFLKD